MNAEHMRRRENYIEYIKPLEEAAKKRRIRLTIRRKQLEAKREAERQFNELINSYT